MYISRSLVVAAILALIQFHGVPAAAAAFDGVCMAAPQAPLPQNVPVVEVANDAQLQQAVRNASGNSVILLAPGEYRLSSTLWVGTDNLTIRGNSRRCDEVWLRGQGMENAAGADSVPHGIWTNAAGLKVQNLTISDVYFHAISIDGLANSPEIYNVRLQDTGEQFIKSNSAGFPNGADNGTVEYSVLAYTNAPPITDHGGGGTGYLNGVDVHGGDGWRVSHNRFENFHTPDSADNLYNPAILFWNGATDTVVEGNTFVDVDRAIAFGLVERGDDHRGGVIRNNMIVMRRGLYSSSRTTNSDAAIILWNSPGTKVLHNTIMLNDNLNSSIQLRFNSNGATVQNNLVSAPVTDRSANSFVAENNVLFDDLSVFRAPDQGDLHLLSADPRIAGVSEVLPDASVDFDSEDRSANRASDVGADEYIAAGFCVAR